MSDRRVREIAPSRVTLEGAGVRLHRAVGFGPPEKYDPFLLLDDFRSEIPSDYTAGFPWHPHRGIETITYVWRGTLEHRDSLNNRGVIAPGDVQWMTAGSGILHQEMPVGDDTGVMHGFQLWTNLPAAQKMIAPCYREIRSAEIPAVLDAGGATVRVISGCAGGVRGPIRDVVTNPEYLDVELPAGRSFTHPTPRGHTVIAYVTNGRAAFDPARDVQVAHEHLVWFTDGDQVRIAAPAEPVRFLLISARPIGEPIAWGGPIVMNTADELRVAFQELDAGTFIKVHHP